VVPEWSDFETVGEITGYRNKMEFGFWGDDDGLQLAHYVRGTHGKQKVDGSILTNDSINNGAQAILAELRKLDIWGGDLKTLVLRSSTENQVVAALFMKKELDMSKFELPTGIKGIDMYFSDPQSPASVPTKKLYSLGDIKLTDTIMGKNITYDVMSFFQVNLPVFEKALSTIKSRLTGDKIVDFYSGVGTIGIPLGASSLIESEKSNIEMAKLNAEGTTTKVIHATSETALDHITADNILIVDPPRAGLHMKVIDRIAEVRPLQIVYLSCNPSTQARDIRLLSEFYDVTYAQGFNFFPRTPHIESLIVLKLK
jgi:23S rRNA (uracil1939-C5)-methyltransferase